MGTHVIPDVVDLVEVQESGTLSRVLHTEGVRLVAFAFDAGQELTEHSSALPAIVQVLSGAIEFEAAGTRHELRPSSWVYLAPGEPHSLLAVEPSVVLLTLVRSDAGATGG